MKQSLLILLSCVLYISNAQNYIPFPEADVSWVYYEITWSGTVDSNGNNVITEEYSPHEVSLTGSTVINGKTYTVCNNSRLYREENKKIYELNTSDSTDMLIYDFNLTTGDTLTLEKDGTVRNFIVQNEDSVLVGSTYHRVLDFDGLQHIEGIGSNKGPFYWDIFFTTDIDYAQTCFTDSTGIYIMNVDHSFTEGSVCTSYLSVQDLNKDHFNWYIQNNALFFTSIAPNSHIAIYNTAGQLVISKANDDTNVLDIQSLKTGIYICQIRKGNQIVESFKFVK